MVAAQTVFRAVPLNYPPPKAKEVPVQTVPAVDPKEDILDRFWRRVAQVTTRYHDVEHKWICGDEIRQWNLENRQACEKCSNSKTRRICVVDEDQPSCRSCRDAKIACDRKPKFVFDMTKDEFFPNYDQFLVVFKNKEPGRLVRYDYLMKQSKKKETQGAIFDCVGGRSNGAPSSSSYQESAHLIRGHNSYDTYLLNLPTPTQGAIKERYEGPTHSGHPPLTHEHTARLRRILIDEIQPGLVGLLHDKYFSTESGMNSLTARKLVQAINMIRELN